MVSADVESSTRLRAINLKLFDFIRKPVAPEVLLETIGRALGPVAKTGRLIRSRSLAAACCHQKILHSETAPDQRKGFRP